MKSRKPTELIYESVPNLQESIISRVNSDQTVSIVNLELDDVCFTLDGIAAEVWAEIDGEKSVEQISAKMIDKHHPPLKKFKLDLENLLKQLQEENLILLK